MKTDHPGYAGPRRVGVSLFTPRSGNLERVDGICPGCGGVAYTEDFTCHHPDGLTVTKRVFRCARPPRQNPCPATAITIEKESTMPYPSKELIDKYRRLTLDQKNLVCKYSGLDKAKVMKAFSPGGQLSSPDRLAVLTDAVDRSADLGAEAAAMLTTGRQEHPAEGPPPAKFAPGVETAAAVRLGELWDKALLTNQASANLPDNANASYEDPCPACGVSGDHLCDCPEVKPGVNPTYADFPAKENPTEKSLREACIDIWDAGRELERLIDEVDTLLSRFPRQSLALVDLAMRNCIHFRMAATND